MAVIRVEAPPTINEEIGVPSGGAFTDVPPSNPKDIGVDPSIQSFTQRVIPTATSICIGDFAHPLAHGYHAPGLGYFPDIDLPLDQ